MSTILIAESLSRGVSMLKRTGRLAGLCATPELPLGRQQKVLV